MSSAYMRAYKVVSFRESLNGDALDGDKLDRCRGWVGTHPLRAEAKTPQPGQARAVVSMVTTCTTTTSPPGSST
jgi:hypothetical protein